MATQDSELLNSKREQAPQTSASQNSYVKANFGCVTLRFVDKNAHLATCIDGHCTHSKSSHCKHSHTYCYHAYCNHSQQVPKRFGKIENPVLLDLLQTSKAPKNFEVHVVCRGIMGHTKFN